MMLPVQLTDVGLEDVRQRLRRLMVKPSLYADYGVPFSVLQDILDELPEQPGLWEVPEWAVPMVRHALSANPDVKQALRIAALRDQKRVQVAMRRMQVARQLFNDWHGVIDGEIAGALWHNLNVEDRQVWLDKATAKLEEQV
jgi:hypothetical protein